MCLPFRCSAAFLAVILSCSLTSSNCGAQENKFEERHEAIKKQVEKRNGRTRNPAVHSPPMIKTTASDLQDAEPVIGVYLSDEARAYPLTMLFGGGGIFELLNDTCGGQPIAASW